MHKLSVGPNDYKKAKKEIKSRYLKELGINALFPKTIDEHKRVFDSLNNECRFVLLQQLLKKSSSQVEHALLSSIALRDLKHTEEFSRVLAVGDVSIPIEVYNKSIEDGLQALPIDITYLIRSLSYEDLTKLADYAALDNERRSAIVRNCSLEQYSAETPFIALNKFIAKLTSERVAEPALEV